MAYAGPIVHLAAAGARRATDRRRGERRIARTVIAHSPPSAGPSWSSRMEIVLTNGVKVIVDKDVDAEALATRCCGDDDPDPEPHADGWRPAILRCVRALMACRCWCGRHSIATPQRRSVRVSRPARRIDQGAVARRPGLIDWNVACGHEL